jgi:pimeloyl-ACP methyl ester carboxylesterase
MLQIESKHVELVSGRILWVEIYGSRSSNCPTLLFANGMASTTNAWSSLVHSFSAEFLASHTVILHDAANTGKSLYQPELPAPTLTSIATEARQLLEHLGRQYGYWIGHSFGGQQGFVAAQHDPNFWKGLLLLAPQTDRVTPHCRTSMNAIASVFRSDPDTSRYADEIYDTPGSSLISKGGIYGALAREMALRQRAESMVLAFGALLGPHEGDFDWQKMTTKIVLVFGGRDAIAPPSEGHYAFTKLRSVPGAKATLVVLPDSGHWMNWEEELRVRDEIIKLVAV